MSRRLYVAHEGDARIFCMASTYAEARGILGEECRSPNSDDVRAFWKFAKLETLSSAEIRQRFGVSRQTVDNWWRKAGGNVFGARLPRRSDQVSVDREARVREILHQLKKRKQPIVATEVARKAHVSLDFARHVADKCKIPLASWHRRPTDDELVEIAKGKTWPEMAEAVGLRLSTLRTYVYARPELSARIREVRKSRPCGPSSHGKVDPKKVMRLHKKGLSAYAISLQLGVEQMVVRYWITKQARGDAHAKDSNDHGPVSHAVGRSNGGTERHE